MNVKGRYVLRIILMLIFLSLVSNIFITPPLLANSLIQEFRQAKMFFDRGNLKRSGQRLVRILKKYPRHSPSNFLLGRIYYRQGKFKKSAKYFAKSRNFIASDGAFEYGMALYQVNRCSDAVKGFRLVPINYPYKGYANFYSGVCFIKMQRWSLADQALRAANNISLGYLDARNKYLFEIQRKQREEMAMGSYYSRPIQILPTPSYTPADALPSLTKDGEKIPDIPMPKTPPPNPFTIAFTPKTEYSILSTKDDLSGHGSRTKQENIFKVSLDVQPSYSITRSGGRQIILSIPSNVYYQNYSATTINTHYTYGTTPDDIFMEESPPVPLKNTVFHYAVSPTGVLPIADSLSLEGKYTLAEDYLDAKPENKSSSHTAAGSLSYNYNTHNFKLSGSYKLTYKGDGTEAPPYMLVSGEANGAVTNSGSYSLIAKMENVAAPVDTTLEGFESRYTGQLSLRRNWPIMNATITALGVYNMHPAGKIIHALPVASAGAKADLNIPFNWGLSITGGGEFMSIIQHDYSAPSTTTDGTTTSTGSISVSGSKTGAYVEVKIAPLSWFYLSGRYGVALYEYSTPKDADKKTLVTEFEKLMPDVQNIWNVKAGISKTF